MFRYHNLQTNLQPNNLQTENSSIHVYKQPTLPQTIIQHIRSVTGRGGGYNQHSQHDSRAEKGKESNIKNTNVQV